jgi:glycosyltransferase involved in cell wall biosynthesis
MEPENNVEIIIQGYLGTKHPYPLFIIGSTDNKFGEYLTGKYNSQGIKFAGSMYDKNLLNNLRFFSSIYFHGHSVGGTNPSLLEAMACGCNIAAHDNIFNKAVLANEAQYFFSASDIAAIINKPKELSVVNQNKILNTEKVLTIYNPGKIVNAYEELIVHACR